MPGSLAGAGVDTGGTFTDLVLLPGLAILLAVLGI
jgi:hypothetical protein